MKTLNRNCIWIYYALVAEEADTYDEYGNLTGCPELVYAAPMRAKMAFGTRQGGISLTAHGLEDNYQQRLITDDMSCPITTGTIIWIDAYPMDCDGHEVPHTHVVSAVVPSINSIAYLLTEVARP